MRYSYEYQIKGGFMKKLLIKAKWALLRFEIRFGRLADRIF